MVIKRIIYSIFSSALFFWLMLFAVKATAATLVLSPAAATIAVGQTQAVNILLDTQGAATDGVDVYSLHFNPSIVQVVDDNSSVSGVQITPGSLLTNTIVNNANNPSGTIQFSQASSGGTSYTGAGTLATIHFKAIANGSSNISLDFTPGKTSDSNVASIGVDKLSSVGNAMITVGTNTNTQSPTNTAATKPSDGTLCKDSSSPAIYVIENGQKRPFASMAALTGQGYKLSNVKILDISSVPTGDPIQTATTRHIRGAVVLDHGTVYFLGASLRYAFPSAAVFASWGHTFSEVVPANDADKLPDGPVVSMKS